MKYIFFLYFTYFALTGYTQTHYVHENDTGSIWVDTMSMGHHGTSYSYFLNDSLEDGLWILTHDQDTTKPQTKCTYQNYVKHGVYQTFERDGTLTSDGYYVNGKLVHIIYYYNSMLTFECLEDAFTFFNTGKSWKDFSKSKKHNCNCRGMKDGDWTYNSRRHKRCFLKRIKKEQHKWTTESNQTK